MDELLKPVPNPLYLVTTGETCGFLLGRVYTDRYEALNSRAVDEYVVELQLSNAVTVSGGTDADR